MFTDGLLSSGGQAILRAIREYRPGPDIPFQAYVHHRIFMEMDREIQRQAGTPTELPYQRHKVCELIRTFDMLSHKLSRRPNAGELCDALGWSGDEMETVLRSAGVIPAPDESDRPSSGLYQLIRDAGHRGAIVELNVREWQNALRSLGDRDRKVIELRYGLAVEPPATLQQVGDLLGVSRERVRQIQERAAGRLGEAARRTGLMYRLS